MARAENIARARTLVNQLLARRTIVDDGAYDPNWTDEQLRNWQMLMKKSESARMKIQLELKKAGVSDPTDEMYWLKYGDLLAENDTYALRCCGSAALCLYVLANDSEFSANLTVVRQGRQGNEHYFLLANADPSVFEVNYGDNFPNFGNEAFMIDLWGAAVRRQRGSENISPVLAQPRLLYQVSRQVLKSIITMPATPQEELPDLPAAVVP